MAGTLDGEKREARKAVLALMAALPPRRRAAEEDLVQAALQSAPEWGEARTVLVYRSIAPELSVAGITLASWRAGKRVLFPRIADVTGGRLELHEVKGWSELRPGPFGILEPAAGAEVLPSAVDLSIVPGVAFDAQGGRLGRGGGYYDRLIPLLGGPAWGVGFDVQVLDRVPAGPQDARVARVVAPCAVGNG